MNKIILKETHAEIIINSPKYGTKHVLIDLDDVDKVKNLNWCVREQKRTKSVVYYSFTVQNKIYIQLHRFITNCPKNMTIDHINHNTLDNRKINLKICTHAKNNQNRKIVSKTSEHNIYFEDNKYRVRVQKNYKNISYGSFNTLEDAIKVRDKYIK